MNKENLYTVQIILHRMEPGTQNHETHEFQNCTIFQVDIIKKSIWVRGCQISQSPDVWEIVSPLYIKAVFVINQNRKAEIKKPG